jgi:hypothetical protein
MGVRYYILAALFIAGCGADGGAGPVEVVVRNRSQFELLDLRFHALPEYAEAVNLLQAPLGVEEAVSLTFPNDCYVTAMRRKIEVGDVIAVTSAAPLPEMQQGATLLVFDMSFRIQPPAQPDAANDAANPAALQSPPTDR